MTVHHSWSIPSLCAHDRNRHSQPCSLQPPTLASTPPHPTPPPPQTETETSDRRTVLLSLVSSSATPSTTYPFKRLPSEKSSLIPPLTLPCRSRPLASSTHPSHRHGQTRNWPLLRPHIPPHPPIPRPAHTRSILSFADAMGEAATHLSLSTLSPFTSPASTSAWTRPTHPPPSRSSARTILDRPQTHTPEALSPVPLAKISRPRDREKDHAVPVAGKRVSFFPLDLEID